MRPTSSPGGARPWLADADCIIYAGSLVNPALLGLAKPGCAIYNSAEMTLEQVLDTIRAAEKAGGTTVRLHTGDPCLYGAIREQMDALDATASLMTTPRACPASAARRRRSVPSIPCQREPDRHHHPDGGPHSCP